MSDCPSFRVPVPLLSAAKVDGLYYLPVLRDSIILILRVRQKSVAGQEYARPRTGVRITRGNSGNGALLTREIRAGREHKHGPNEALTIAGMRVSNEDRSPLKIKG